MLENMTSDELALSVQHPIQLLVLLVRLVTAGHLGTLNGTNVNIFRTRSNPDKQRYLERIEHQLANLRDMYGGLNVLLGKTRHHTSEALLEDLTFLIGRFEDTHRSARETQLRCELGLCARIEAQHPTKPKCEKTHSACFCFHSFKFRYLDFRREHQLPCRWRSEMVDTRDCCDCRLCFCRYTVGTHQEKGSAVLGDDKNLQLGLPPTTRWEWFGKFF